MPFEFRLVDAGGRIRVVGELPVAKGGKITKGALFIDLKKSSLEDRKTNLKIEVISKGKVIDRVKTNFLGPVQ